MAGHYAISQIRILLVEPSSVQANAIMAQMRQLGITSIDHVTQGDDALKALQQDTPELLMSAMYLEDMTGVELLTRIRALPESQDLAFILVSSETRPQMLEPVRQLGACAIVPKPFSFAQLERALSTALDYLSEDASFDHAIQSLESLRVLLVDDSRAARNYMRRVLENLGILSIIEANDGQEAVALLAASCFDLVVTDYNMPEMDGRELIEYIRKSSWQSSVPILMVSSEQDSGRLAAVEQAGVSGICDKPFEPAVVRNLLERILEHRDA